MRTNSRLAQPVPSGIGVKHLTSVVIAIMLSTTVARAQDAQLTLDEAITIGLANNRAVANQAMQVEKADNDVATARSRRLPKFAVDTQASQLLRPVSLMFPRGAFGVLDGIGPLPSTDAEVTTPSRMSFIVSAQAAQPITQLFKLNLNVRQSQSALASEKEQLRDTQLTLVAEIRRVYYDIVQTQGALHAQEHAIALLEEMNRVVATRVIQQVALKSDALTTQSKLASAELRRVELHHALATRKEQLNQLLGRDVRTAFDVTAMPDALVVDVDLEDAQARAIEARPDVKQARLRVEQAELAVRVAKADYRPDVSLVMSYLTPMNITGAPRHIASGAVQLQWEPFDWGRKARAVASKDLAVRQAQNSLRETEDRAALEVAARYRTLESARARLRAARAAEAAAQETARVSLMQYGKQAALFADVLQTQSVLADSNYQYQQALAAFWSARADFERATAEDRNQ